MAGRAREKSFPPKKKLRGEAPQIFFGDHGRPSREGPGRSHKNHEGLGWFLCKVTPFRQVWKLQKALESFQSFVKTFKNLRQFMNRSIDTLIHQSIDQSMDNNDSLNNERWTMENEQWTMSKAGGRRIEEVEVPPPSPGFS